MTEIAAIAYTRGMLSCGFMEVDQAAQSDTRRNMQRAYENGAVVSNVYDVSQFQGDVSEIIRKAVNWIFDQGAAPDKWVVTGYGPFNFRDGSQSTLGSIREAADPPFNGRPIVSLVADYIGEHHAKKPKIELITDVAAMATDEYWRTSHSRKPEHPHVVCAMIIGTGIGGAFVQKPGLILGQNYHSEIGHVPVSRIPDDPLEYSGCRFHKTCVSAFASFEALGWRARAMGVEVDDIFDTDNDLLWKIEANYVAQLCMTAVLTVAPTRIALGGSIVKYRANFVSLLKKELKKMIGEYIDYPALHDLNYLFVEIDRDEAMLRGAIQHGIWGVQRANVLKIGGRS